MPIYSAALNIAAIQYETAIDYAGTYQKVMVEFDFLHTAFRNVNYRRPLGTWLYGHSTQVGIA